MTNDVKIKDEKQQYDTNHQVKLINKISYSLSFCHSVKNLKK